MSIRKQVIKNLHFQHGPKPEPHVFIRYGGDPRGTLRDMENLEELQSRREIENEYGALRPCDMSPTTVGPWYWCEFVRLCATDVIPKSRPDKNGDRNLLYETFRPAKDSSSLPFKAPATR